MQVPVRGMLLAAGASTRMGGMKQLLPFGSSSVVEHVVDTLLASRLEELVVVLGHEHERVARRLTGKRVRIALNPGYAQGMTSSVKCGLVALGVDARAALVALVDQPLITSSLVNTVIGAFWRSGKAICIPSYRGRRGHPVVFDLKYRDEILSLAGDAGLKEVWRAHPDDIHHVEVDTDVTLRDMNYPEEYQAQLREHSSKSVGDREQA